MPRGRNKLPRGREGWQRPMLAGPAIGHRGAATSLAPCHGECAGHPVTRTPVLGSPAGRAAASPGGPGPRRAATQRIPARLSAARQVVHCTMS
eukprot:230521-Hanusia_phi.AAC.1